VQGETVTDSPTRRTVALFIPSLEIGGAERQLLELAKGLDKERWNVLVLTSSLNADFAAEAGDVAGLRILLLDRTPKVLFPFRLLAALKREKPCLLTSYLLSAQAYTLLIRPFLPRTRIVFSVRDAADYGAYHGARGRWFRMLVERSGAWVDAYIFNSAAGRKVRNRLPADKAHVIPNGIDTNAFRPDPAAGAFVRREAGIVDMAAPVVGIVANFSPYKGYDTFIRAARIVADRMPAVRFVAIGNFDTPLGSAMRRLVHELELSGSFHFLGSRPDVRRLLPGFDVVCSSSVTEGFSNSICEGMASAVPCVVTDVGDSAAIAGDTGIVVPTGEHGQFAAGILALLELSPEERRLKGDAARLRIVEQFSIPRMVTATEELYEHLLSAGR
jgi:glycosyltransferase involved in cell wall biosynthesis